MSQAGLNNVTSTPTVATTFNEDVGTATPVANVLNIRGASGITTSGAGNTVTISAALAATTFNEDSGSATPVANVIQFFGGSGIATSGAGNTVTISATGAAFAWVDLGVSLNPGVKETGYFITANSTVTLPAAPAQGDTIVFDVTGAGTTLIIQASGTQLIRFANQVSSAGGTATSTATGDSCRLTYQTSSTTWHAVSGFSGNWTMA